MFGKRAWVAGALRSSTMGLLDSDVSLGRLRLLSQGAFAGLFVWILATGQYRFWMIVVALGLATATIAGRWYCGWACPIGSAYRAIDRVYATLGVERRDVPDGIRRRSWLRWAIAAGFVGVFVANRALGLGLAPIPYVVAAGVAVGLAFDPATFHGHLCPFGTLFRLVSARQRFGLTVDADECPGCATCTDVCPSGAIEVDDTGTPSIDSGECLTCFACREACPLDGIRYE